MYAKGQRYLLEAMEILVPTRPRLVLLVAGRLGDMSRELERLRDRPGLRGQVHLLGHPDDVPEILAAADLFVFPSLYEGLPGAVIEAMALGLPVIASRIEPVREIVEEGSMHFWYSQRLPSNSPQPSQGCLKTSRPPTRSVNGVERFSRSDLPLNGACLACLRSTNRFYHFTKRSSIEVPMK